MCGPVPPAGELFLASFGLSVVWVGVRRAIVRRKNRKLVPHVDRTIALRVGMETAIMYGLFSMVLFWGYGFIYGGIHPGEAPFWALASGALAASVAVILGGSVDTARAVGRYFVAARTIRTNQTDRRTGSLSVVLEAGSGDVSVVSTAGGELSSSKSL